MSAPVGPTCPDVNAAQKLLREVEEDAKRELTDSTMRYVVRALEKVDDLLEQLRTANDKLRRWGDETEHENERLRDELAGAEEQIERLQLEVGGMEEVVSDAWHALAPAPGRTRRQRIAAARELLSDPEPT